MMSDVESAKPQFFTSTSAIWDAMYADCEHAQKSIELDQYIIEDDEIGRRFLTLFTQKAKAGVAVHLLLDFIGSYSVYQSQLIDDLVAAGGVVRFFNKLPKHRIFRPAKWFPRNHVKVLMIDSDIAYVGSACMRDDMADWRDSTVRLTGNDAAPVDRRLAYARLLWWARPKRAKARQYHDTDNQFEFSIRSPGMGINPIYRGMIHAIRRAQKSVLIATPYFLAPYALRRAIKRAAKRGVEVKIITNERSDVRIADMVSASYFNGLIKRGISIFAYQHFMLHAKVVIVDDNWASIGSTNIDYLSLRVNREANLIVHDPIYVSVLRAQFMDDLKKTRLVDRSEWRARPVWERALGYLGRSIKAVL